MDTFSQETAFHLILFRLEDVEYGVEILSVREVLPLGEIIQIPGKNSLIEGFIKHTEGVLPVISLRKMFGLEDKPHDKKTRVLLTDIFDKRVGFIVDEVHEILKVPKSTVTEDAAVIHSGAQDFVRGVANIDDRIIIILDIEKVLSDTQKTQLHEM